MEPHLVAVDIDGTLYDGSRIAPAATAALHRTRVDGHTIVVVTGRRWSAVPELLGPSLADVGLVVAEDGGVLVDVTTGDETMLAPPLDPHLVDALRDAGVDDLDIGRVTVGADARHLDAFHALADPDDSRYRVVANKESVSLMPIGHDKGTGLHAAIARLGAHEMPILAIGDAENDLPMFDAATIAIAVANADAAVRDAGIACTTAEYGDGVEEALRILLGVDVA